MSTPTVSRFEGGDKNIQLVSALAILNALGLVERSEIAFPDRAMRFDFDRDAVLFPAWTADGDMTCAISGEALTDHFGAQSNGARATLSAFRAHRRQIEDAAKRLYLEGRREADGTILVRTADI